MATRRCFKTLPRHYSFFFSSNPPLKNLNTTVCAFYSTQTLNFENPISNLNQNHHFNLNSSYCNQFNSLRHFSSQRRNRGIRDEEEEEDDDEDNEVGEDDDEEEEDDELSECSEGEEDVDDPRSKAVIKRTYTVEEKEEEAAAIGYKVIGPLDPKEEPFKNREPYFAVVQIGSHQFKVSNGDYIYTEKLKFCEVNDKLVLNKVLMVGSQSQTIIGRPILPEAAVHAVVEEHALDAKVIIFKKKRRKNYRRTKGHRQELTRLRITDIQGITKPDIQGITKPEEVEKVTVAA